MLSRRLVPRVLAVLTLTLALTTSLHAAPRARDFDPGSFWTRAISWLTSLWSGQTSGQPGVQTDKGGLIDPNGGG